MEWRNKFFIAMGVDVLDFILGSIGLLANISFPILAVGVNNARGLIYDLIALPILIYMFGSHGSIGILEIPISEEIDMFIPTSAITALLARRNK